MNKIYSLILGLLFQTIIVGNAQVNGCTDPLASNYNANATFNDGSCQYPVTNYSPIKKTTLKSTLNENSGLIWAKNEWWLHNDSNSDPIFYSIDPDNGDINKKIELVMANNEDWEDVATDGMNLYFADVGNNNSDRMDLGVYKVPFTAIGGSNNQIIDPDEYSFLPISYPDQIDFNSLPEDSSTFDCEAMIYYQGRLHFFTKRRADNTTVHYALNPANGMVEKLETFNCNGLITGASISPDNRAIALIGYDLRNLPTAFCWLLWDWQAGSDQFFSGNKRKIELGSALLVGQVESICFDDLYSGYLTNERTSYGGILLVEPTLYSFDFSQWIAPMVATQEAEPTRVSIRLSPNPTPGQLYVELSGIHKSSVSLVQIMTNRGDLLQSFEGLSEQIDCTQLPDGAYWLKVFSNNGECTSKVFIKH